MTTAYMKKVIDDLKKMPTGGYGQPSKKDIDDMVKVLMTTAENEFHDRFDDTGESAFFFDHKGREWEMFYSCTRGWWAEKNRES
jgi:hypothetical protein